MQIIIKQLAGPEWSLNISDESTIADLKENVEQKWKIKKNNQRLVFKGKTLEDSKTVGYYELTEGAKLFLSVKKKDGGGDVNQSSPTIISQPSVEQSSSISMMSAAAQMLQSLLPQREPVRKIPVFWDELSIVLKKYYKEEDVRKIVDHYKRHFKETVASLSLDDVERLATNGMNREQGIVR